MFNPKYTFESFITGTSNNFACAAAKAIAETPGKSYNPLFIYGGAGFGKTHLLHAIGQHASRNKIGARVAYLSAEQFTSELTQAIQNNQLAAFRQKYLQMDALLIDDIQFLAGQEHLQEEFSHTFNALHEAHKQIVMACACAPGEMPELEDCLVSRFEWGLVTDLQPPDVRLRDKESGRHVQVEIGSWFDEDQNQFFLTYLLSRVFGGSIVDLVSLGRDSLWDMLLAFLFRQRLLEAIAVGLFKQYRTFDHNDTRVRGRIDVNEHLRRNIPFRGNVAYATHEITFDNPTNHLIRHALAKVAQKWGGLLTGDNRLTEARHQLEQNTPTWQSGGVMACIRRKENRIPIKHPYFQAVYEPLRQVSLAILRDEGASLYQQQQEAEGVIFDGSWLWEEYLWTILKPLGFEHPENKEKKEPWEPLPSVLFYPDFFHKQKRVVLDAKYKRDKVSQDDAKQVFAYMFLLDAIHSGLIKPDGEQNKQGIRRQHDNAEAADWHDFVLIPPATSSTSSEFLEQMRVLETVLQKGVKELLM